MKKMIAKVGPTLIEKGYLSIIIDHKFVNNTVSNYQSNAYGLLALLNFNKQSEKYLLALEPSDTSGKFESCELTTDVLREYSLLMETDDQQNVDEEDLSAPRMSRKTKETLKEFNFAEVIESVPIPIIADSMAICIAKQFSIVFSTCMAHTLHNVLKGTVKKSGRVFRLER